MNRWLALTVLLFAVVANAGDSVDITKPSADVAAKRLAKTEIFAIGGIGYAGTISEGEKDFRVIMALPRGVALEILERLYTTGNPQAKSYALVGIRKLDGNRFNKLLQELKTPGELVKTQSGCIVGRVTLHQIAERIKIGVYDYWPVLKKRPVMG